jgi:hypothetical protein
MAGRWPALSAFRTLALLLATALLLPGASGCGRGSGSTEPEAKVRLTRLLRLYQLYAGYRSRAEGDRRTDMRTARVMGGAGTGGKMARPGRRAASRPELGVPAPIFTLKAAITP